MNKFVILHGNRKSMNQSVQYLGIPAALQFLSNSVDFDLFTTARYIQ